MKRNVALVPVLAIWVFAALAGWHWFSRSNAPRATGPAAPAWPESTTLSRAPSGPTILFFAHPHCPCTEAGLRELAWVRKEHRALHVHVLFVRPTGAPAQWERGATWHWAQKHFGSTVAIDEGGGEAQRFGARRSSEVLAYSASGHLRFHGGLSETGPGHGSHGGARALLAQMASDRGLLLRPVVGCPLMGPVPD